jgi:hypothetical protein
MRWNPFMWSKGSSPWIEYKSPCICWKKTLEAAAEDIAYGRRYGRILITVTNHKLGGWIHMKALAFFMWTKWSLSDKALVFWYHQITSLQLLSLIYIEHQTTCLVYFDLYNSIFLTLFIIYIKTGYFAKTALNQSPKFTGLCWSNTILSQCCFYVLP